MNATIVSTIRTHLYALTHASSAPLSPEPNDRLAGQGGSSQQQKKNSPAVSVCVYECNF